MKVPAIKLVLLVALAAAAVGAPVIHAGVPRLLAWQGVALDSNNVPVTDSTYGFTFRIWDDGAGGSLLWQESQLVTTENGVLNVLLGSNNPVPDSVFAGPDRYLEVQFAAEPPYTPRTQIVSVGYAYRVSTVDGATGGAVSTDIELKSPFGAPSIRLYREGALSPIMALQSTVQGGVLELYDEMGSLQVSAFPDPVGTGGALLVLTDSAGTTGARILSGGTGNPEFLLIGAGAYARMFMGASGDSSVVLPANAINESEILNEPGLAAGLQQSATLSTTSDTMASATATFPTSGYVVVICQAILRGETPNTYLTCNLYDNGASKTSWYWDPGDVDSPSVFYDLAQHFVYTGSVGAGSHTFHFTARTSSGTARAQDAKVVVMYFPTAYGSVYAPTTMSLPGDHQTALPDIAPVDAAAEREASIRANRDRIERELAAMRMRMEELAAELRRTAESRSSDQ